VILQTLLLPESSLIHSITTYNLARQLQRRHRSQEHLQREEYKYGREETCERPTGVAE